MNSQKYLTKNELNYFNNVIEEAKINNRINDIIKKEIITKKIEFKPEIKDYLIKVEDDKLKDKNIKEQIEETFKKNLLSIMTPSDYDKIKDNEFFNVYNKNIINVNFERIKSYIKKNYVKLNLDEFIPIIKLIYDKKELEKTDTFNIKVNNNYDELIKKINNYFNYLNTQIENIKDMYGIDISHNIKEENKKKLNVIYNKILNDIKIIYDEIDKLNTMAKSYYDKINLNNDKETNLKELEKLFNIMVKYENNKVNYFNEYINEKNKVFNVIKTSALEKITNMVRTFKFRKNLIINKINKGLEYKRINEKEANEIKDYINGLIDNVNNELEDENNNENQKMNVLVEGDNQLNKIEEKINNDIEDESTEAYTDMTQSENQSVINEKPQITEIQNYTEAQQKIIDIQNNYIASINSDKKIKKNLKELYIKKLEELYSQLDFSNDKNFKESINKIYKNKDLEGDTNYIKKYTAIINNYLNITLGETPKK